ncbi:MAG: RIP metalloprotease RseP [Parcubacteria group bacterium]|nr:RIP metalloprotease RseP [Parcubacteria group bacterium]
MTILIFFAVLSVLVLAHEWGHFVTARRAGVRVEEFGFGFPPRLVSFKRRGTIFSLNLIPFGGFVKIFGEDGEHRQETGSFTSLKISQRARIIAAGVTMNLILAWFLLSWGNLIGRPAVVDETNFASAQNVTIQVVGVAKGSPADLAGLKNSDSLVSASLKGQSQSFATAKEFQDFVASAQGQSIDLTLKRGNDMVIVAIEPRINPPAGEGALGIGLVRVGLVRVPWYQAPVKAVKDVVWLTGAVAYSLAMFFGSLIFKGQLMGDVSGPVGIATLAGQAYRMGLSYLIQLTALLSINLAILNILPFPALDGGRLIFLAAEKIKGSPLGQKLESRVNMVGFALLLLLMLFVTWKDIARLF